MSVESSYLARVEGVSPAGGWTEGWPQPIKGAMKHVDYVSGVVVEDYRVASAGKSGGLNGYRLFVEPMSGGEDKWKVW